MIDEFLKKFVEDSEVIPRKCWNRCMEANTLPYEERRKLTKEYVSQQHKEFLEFYEQNANRVELFHESLITNDIHMFYRWSYFNLRNSFEDHIKDYPHLTLYVPERIQSKLLFLLVLRDRMFNMGRPQKTIIHAYYCRYT